MNEVLMISDFPFYWQLVIELYKLSVINTNYADIKTMQRKIK
jgi:hypothetical protein